MEESEIKVKSGVFKVIDRLTAFFFYLGLCIEIFAVILDKSSWTNPFEGILFRTAFILFSIRCLASIRRYSGRELFLVGILAVITFVDWHFCGRNDLIRILSFVFACRTIRIRKAELFTFFGTLAGCLVLNGLAAAGILGHLYQTYDYGHGLETRWDFGLGHPNSMHCMAAMLLIFALYLFEKRMKLYIYLLLAVGNVLLYGLTKSNTAFFVGMAALILSLIMHYGKSAAKGNVFYFAGEALLAAGLFFSLAVGILSPSSHPALARVDKVLTGRISTLWETTFQEGTLPTWKWFGSRSNQMYFDLGWVRLVYWYGILPALIIIGLLFAMLGQARKKKDQAAFVMLFCFAVYTVFEAHLVSTFIGRNYAFFLAARFLPEMVNGTGRKASDYE